MPRCRAGQPESVTGTSWRYHDAESCRQAVSDALDVVDIALAPFADKMAEALGWHAAAIRFSGAMADTRLDPAPGSKVEQPRCPRLSPMSVRGIVCAKTRSDLVVMPCGKTNVRALVLSPPHHRPQNSGCIPRGVLTQPGPKAAELSDRNRASCGYTGRAAKVAATAAHEEVNRNRQQGVPGGRKMSRHPRPWLLTGRTNWMVH
jgi:hypothetical protein